MLTDIRCKCGRLLARLKGVYEIKCPRCKNISLGSTTRKRSIAP